jgi:hypothetical protein
MTYWLIDPYHDSDEADQAMLPAETDEDHNAALEYAMERLESLWDAAQNDKPFTVTMTLCSGPMPAKR